MIERPWEDPSRVPWRPPAAGVPEVAAPAQRSSPWGWRALVAFLAGGLLTGLGVAAAMLTDDDEPTASVTDASGEAAAPVGTDPAAFVAERLGPSVVQIETDIGLGSGVVVGEATVVSNHHVVEGADQMRVRLSDGRTLDASLIGSDPRTDVAIIAVDDEFDLPIAVLALDDLPQVGELTVAIGSPFQLQQSVTSGIVSAVNRPIFDGSHWNAMIQTDAAINPGNSGGALANRDGAVIGINTAIQTDGTTASNAGVGFAMPITTVMDVVARIEAGDSLEPAFLGVRGQEPSSGVVGVEVVNVEEGSAAANAGLREGDIVVSIDGAPVTNFQELAGLIQTSFPGDEVVLEVSRSGEPITISVTLGGR